MSCSSSDAIASCPTRSTSSSVTSCSSVGLRYAITATLSTSRTRVSSRGPRRARPRCAGRPRRAAHWRRPVTSVLECAAGGQLHRRRSAGLGRVRAALAARRYRASENARERARPRPHGADRGAARWLRATVESRRLLACCRGRVEHSFRRGFNSSGDWHRCGIRGCLPATVRHHSVNPSSVGRRPESARSCSDLRVDSRNAALTSSSIATDVDSNSSLVIPRTERTRQHSSTR